MIEAGPAAEALPTYATDAPVPPAAPAPDRSGFAVAGLLVVVGLAVFAAEQWGWVASFVRAFVSWAANPTTALHAADPVSVPAVRIVGGLAVALVVGRLQVGLLARRSSLFADRFVTAGLTALLAACELGLVGVWEVAVGSVGLWPFVAVGALLLAGCGAATVMMQRRSSPVGLPASRSRTRFDRAGIALVGFAVVVVGWIIVHAATQPVTEFDSLIYHAELPRYWFAHAPAPPLQYGPSIGLQISANYPPLWPAFGLALYELAGRADDLYLRLGAPLLYAGFLLFVFGAARRLFSVAVARWTVTLMLGTPLLVFYAMWPTNYLLLGFLVMVVTVVVVEAARRRDGALWIVAGVLAGFAVLTNFYGWIVVAAGLVVALVSARRRLVPSTAFGVAVAVVGAVWLVRNGVLLGDPLYPLAAGVLHDKGIVPQLWNVTEAQVRSTANAVWSGSTGVTLRIRELSATFWNPLLLPCGVLPGAVALAYGARRSRAAAVAGWIVAGWIVAVLVPGWYFQRALVPLVAPAALGAAIVLARAPSNTTRPGLRTVRTVVLVAAAAIAVVTGVATSMAAPDEMSGAPVLASADWRAGLRDLGNAPATLWSATGGDVLAWQWLGAHVGRHGGEVATLEVRAYDLDPRVHLVYLDGRAGAPLLTPHTPEAAVAYLRSLGVRYVLVPGWAASSPVIGLLGLERVLGGTAAPVAAVFAPYPGQPVTSVYDLGAGEPSSYRAAVWVPPGAPTPTPASYRVPAGAEGRILLSPEAPALDRLLVHYRATGSGTVAVRNGAGTVAQLRCEASAGWRDASFSVPMGADLLMIETGGCTLELLAPTVTAP
ncbi:MAG TPA: glycosyltransferase family 39 protein [Acidimicrobiales bacterium]|nr:glycosyltransferase family 39 protein [Acidimicrobiales bacterium]